MPVFLNVKRNHFLIQNLWYLKKKTRCVICIIIICTSMSELSMAEMSRRPFMGNFLNNYILYLYSTVSYMTQWSRNMFDACWGSR